MEAAEVKPGDFNHMPNLRRLHIAGLREFPEAGTFDGLNNLEDLNIRIATDLEITVSKGRFDDLKALKTLEINNGRGDLILEEGALDGLDQLEFINLGNIREISADDLAGLNRVQHIKIHREWPPSGREEDDPVIPKDLIARLPTVESLTTEGFQWPSALEMNSLEHACLMKDKGHIPYDIVMTVDGKIIQHQDKEHRDGKLFCVPKVDDEIREVPLRAAAINCDGIFRNQLTFQQGASTADRMNVLVSQIQSQPQECNQEVWNPVVIDLDTNSGNPAGKCFSAIAGTLPAAADTMPTIGSKVIPTSLGTMASTTSYWVQKTSGRDPENNILVYFSDALSNRPSDGASCWLYDARIKTWHHN